MLTKYMLVLAVAAFIKDKDGRLLLVKKSPNEKIDPGLWVVPGGKINPGEKILTGLEREVMEEVNLEIIKPRWVNDNVFKSGEFCFHAQHFLTFCPDTTGLMLEKNLVDYAFVKYEDLGKYSIPAGLRETMEIIFNNQSYA